MLGGFMTIKKGFALWFGFCFLWGFVDGFIEGYYGEEPLVYKVDKQ